MLPYHWREELPMYARLSVALVLAAAAFGASAGVVQVAPNGFLIRHEASISAAPAKVYEALVERVGSWWNPSHTYSHDAKNLSIDARPGGCFCERFPAGGGIEHMRIIYVAPGEVIRMSGALGPFQQHGLAGSLTWRLASAPGGTTLSLGYSIGGFMEGGFDRLAPAADAMLGEQVQRLKLFVETGNPTQGAK
jgi:uncharacterized protein YndB with AHSA1/START domain